MDAACEAELSRNQTNYAYRETEEEWLTTLLRKVLAEIEAKKLPMDNAGWILSQMIVGTMQHIKTGGETSERVAATEAATTTTTEVWSPWNEVAEPLLRGVKLEAKQSHAALKMLLQTGHALQYMLRLLSWRGYFRQMEEFKVTWMRPLLHGTYGGVSGIFRMIQRY